MNEYVNRVVNLAFRVVPITSEEKKYVVDGYSETNRKELLRIAEKKKILPVVGKFLCALNLDNGEWKKYYLYFKERNVKVIEQVNEVFVQLHSRMIDHIAVYENFGALLYADTDIALYSSGDVDLFADISYKSQIVNAMEELGYMVTKDSAHERSIMTEFLKEGELVRINIGWIVLRRYSLPISVDTNQVVNWNQLVSYKDTEIRILSKEALLYLCLIRIAVHGYSRSPDVRLYIDIYNVSCLEPDWDIAMQWAKNDGVITKLSTAAYIANRLNGVDVPEKIKKLVKSDQYAKKILEIVYDEMNRTLKYDPSGINLLRMEAASDRRSLLGEILVMLFPPRKWLKEFYLADGEKEIKMYKNYYKRLLKMK